MFPFLGRVRLETDMPFERGLQRGPVLGVCKEQRVGVRVDTERCRLVE